MIGQISLFVVLLPVIAPLLAIGIVLLLLYQGSLYLLIWLLWLPQGKDVLFVTSDSPIWRDYMMEQVFPLVGNRAVTLNWSERKCWPRWSLARHFFRMFAGSREFNPIVVVFRPIRRAEFFRFFTPFKAWKHGNREPVEWLRRQLADCLEKESETVADP